MFLEDVKSNVGLSFVITATLLVSPRMFSVSRTVVSSAIVTVPEWRMSLTDAPTWNLYSPFSMNQQESLSKYVLSSSSVTVIVIVSVALGERTEVFPSEQPQKKESLPVLRREDRTHWLQRHSSSQKIYQRTFQDSSQKNYRYLCKASASGYYRC